MALQAYVNPKQMNMKKLTLFVLLAILALTASAQNSTPDDLVKKFFNEYQKNTRKALDDLYATNPWTAKIKDAIDNLQRQVEGYTIDYVGKYYGYEFIAKKKFSDTFILCSYLVKYDRQPMRFVFKFYKPNDKWHLYAFSIDDDFDDEIEQSAKFYYLNLQPE